MAWPVRGGGERGCRQSQSCRWAGIGAHNLSVGFGRPGTGWARVGQKSIQGKERRPCRRPEKHNQLQPEQAQVKSFGKPSSKVAPAGGTYSTGPGHSDSAAWQAACRAALNLGWPSRSERTGAPQAGEARQAGGPSATARSRFAVCRQRRRSLAGRGMAPPPSGPRPTATPCCWARVDPAGALRLADPSRRPGRSLPGRSPRSRSVRVSRGGPQPWASSSVAALAWAWNPRQPSAMCGGARGRPAQLVDGLAAWR